MAAYYTRLSTRRSVPDATAMLDALRGIDPTIGAWFDGVAYRIKSSDPLSDAQLTAVDAAILAAPEPSEALDAKRDIDGLPAAQRAIFAVLLDEINVVRAKVALSPKTTDAVLKTAGDRAQEIAVDAAADVAVAATPLK